MTFRKLMTADRWLRINLEETAKDFRLREKRARKAYKLGVMKEACKSLADCYAASALIFETELSKHGGPIE